MNIVFEKNTLLDYFTIAILYMFMLMEYIRPPGIPPQLTLLFALMLFGIAIFNRLNATFVIGGIKQHYFLMALLFSSILSIIIGILKPDKIEINISLSENIMMSIIGYSIIYYAMTQLINKPAKVIQYLAGMVLLHLLLFLLNAGNISQINRGYLQIGGYFMGDGNDFALAVNIVLPYAIFLFSYFENKKVLKFISILAVVALIFGVVLTQSRGGILGLSFILIYLGYFSKSRVKAMIGLGIIAFIIVGFLGATYLARMETLTHYQEDSSAMGRINAWTAAIGMFKDRPFFGIGVGNFALAYGIHYKPPEVEVQTWRAAHSFIFQILGELGLAGILSYFGLIFSNLSMSRYLYRKKLILEQFDTERLGRCLFASQIGFFISGAFLSTAYYPHIFLLSGITVASYKLVKVIENHFIADQFSES